MDDDQGNKVKVVVIVLLSHNHENNRMKVIHWLTYPANGEQALTRLLLPGLSQAIKVTLGRSSRSVGVLSEADAGNPLDSFSPNGMLDVG